VSALGGIYNFDGAPVDDSLLAALGRGLDTNGPDGGKEFRSGCLGMAYRALHTNKESRLESQPLVSANGDVICWDGRLDNREDLIHQLGDRLAGDFTDVAIVSHSYVKWGAAFLARLIGDFAISLWDRDSRLLILARDPFGSRTLFYHFGRNRILWASDLASLIDLSGVPLEIEDEYVAGYLTEEPEPTVTPYKHFAAVPPGGYVMHLNSGIVARQYWQVDTRHEISYKTDSEYEEHFREIFRDAVRSRLRADRIVFSELSGGLDSSSIVCVADNIIHAGQAQATGLETISYLYDEAPTCDERVFIDCVEKERRQTGHHLKEEDYRILAPIEDQCPLYFPSVFQLFSRRHRAVSSLMGQRGGRVLLTGQAGDHVLWSEAEGSPELADKLIHLNLLSLHRLAQSWSRIQKRPYLGTIWKNAIWPLLPGLIQAGSPLTTPARWLDQAFLRRTNLRKDPFGTFASAGSRPSTRQRTALLQRAIRWASRGYYQERARIEVSHPFLHRPLVEFLLTIPMDQLLRPGETRSIQRRALRDFLPKRVLRRKGKRGPDEAIYRALARQWTAIEGIISDARVHARGYVDLKILRDELERARYGQRVQSHMILKTISLELWLRSNPASRAV
jgi:asparagine synthase (glutamine-hydrolysing)